MATGSFESSHVLPSLLLNVIFLLQVLHFFIGLGALLSPIIADPFLSETDCILGNATINSSLNLRHLNAISGRHLHNVSHISLNTQGEVVTSVSYAFWIMALVNVSNVDYVNTKGKCAQTTLG